MPDAPTYSEHKLQIEGITTLYQAWLATPDPIRDQLYQPGLEPFATWVAHGPYAEDHDAICEGCAAVWP